jgi:hypothetical protein
MVKKTLVAVTVATTSPVEGLYALLHRSKGAALHAEVTNADGQPLQLCSEIVVASQYVETVVAPSPPPPAPPPPSPPSPPPFNLLDSGIDVFDYVNVSNPVSKALGTLLEAAAETVATAAAVTVTVTVAASATASAVGGAAGGGGGPASLMGAQRNAMYGMLSGPPSDCQAAGAGGGSWTMGRLNFGGNGPCTVDEQGRRLSEVAQEDFVQALLISAMVDTLTSVALIVCVVFVLHILLLLWWHFRMNRSYYAWPQYDFHTILVEKKRDALLGVALRQGYRYWGFKNLGRIWAWPQKFRIFISSIEDFSSCTELLHYHDEILLINGRCVKDAEQASNIIRRLDRIWLLVKRRRPGERNSARQLALWLSRRKRRVVPCNDNDEAPSASPDLPSGETAVASIGEQARPAGPSIAIDVGDDGHTSLRVSHEVPQGVEAVSSATNDGHAELARPQVEINVDCDGATSLRVNVPNGASPPPSPPSEGEHHHTLVPIEVVAHAECRRPATTASGVRPAIAAEAIAARPQTADAATDRARAAMEKNETRRRYLEGSTMTNHDIAAYVAARKQALAEDESRKKENERENIRMKLAKDARERQERARAHPLHGEPADIERINELLRQKRALDNLNRVAAPVESDGEKSERSEAEDLDQVKARLADPSYFWKANMGEGRRQWKQMKLIRRKVRIADYTPEDDAKASVLLAPEHAEEDSFESRKKASGTSRLVEAREVFPKPIRRAHRAARKRPAFRSLPDALCGSNPELTLLVTFSSGLLQTSSAVLGALIAGYRVETRSALIAVLAVVTLTSTYAFQAYKLRVFFKHHASVCWVASDVPTGKDEQDDPLLALLSNILPCKAFTKRFQVPRERGSFEAPEEDDEEPYRTERAISRAFSLWTRPSKSRPGDALIDLYVWLLDASGTPRGLWYLFVMMALQLTTAVMMGILYAHPWTVTPPGGKALLVILILLQALGAFWSFWRTANDRWDGVEKALCFALECTSTCLVLASSILADRSEDEAVDVYKLAQSLQLAGLSAQMLIAAIFVPMAVTVYNTAVVPIFQHVWSSDGSAREIIAQLIMTLILLPWTLASQFAGAGSVGGMSDMAAGFEDSVIDIAGSTERGSVDNNSSGDEEPEVEKPRAPPSAGKVKRLKRIEFLRIIRERKAESSGTHPGRRVRIASFAGRLMCGSGFRCVMRLLSCVRLRWEQVRTNWSSVVGNTFRVRSQSVSCSESP